MKAVRANPLPFPGVSLHMSHPEMAMVIYRKVHTGPKSQGAGVHDGLIRAGYQFTTELAVTLDPANPAAKVMSTKTINAAIPDLCKESPDFPAFHNRHVLFRLPPILAEENPQCKNFNTFMFIPLMHDLGEWFWRGSWGNFPKSIAAGIFLTTAHSSIKAIIYIFPPHLGHTSGSMFQIFVTHTANFLQ
jgi:hypothetical protein